MTVQEISREDVVTVDPDAPAKRIADRMREERVGSVVVTEEDRPVGLVTDRDVGLGVWKAEDPVTVTARDLMTGDLTTVEADEGLYDALRTAREANVRRLPVVEDDHLVGIVSLDDFIVLLTGEFEQVSEIIQAESPPY